MRKHTQQSHSHPMTMHKQHNTHEMSRCLMHAVIFLFLSKVLERLFECGVSVIKMQLSEMTHETAPSFLIHDGQKPKQLRKKTLNGGKLSRLSLMIGG